MKENMTPVAQRLVDLIENEADELAMHWLNDVSKNADLPSYHHFDKEELFNKACEVYRHFGKWVAWEMSREEVAEQYKPYGAL